MKKLLFLLSLSLFLVSCGDKNGFTIKGYYASAPDNTVVYISRYMVSGIDDLLVPFDSAVVRRGKFEFKGVCDKSEVCFVSSSRVVDGSYVVLEPGVVTFDMAERTSRGGTILNDKMNRFLNEKEKVIALRGMCASGILETIASTEEMRDSIVMMASLAGEIFDLYVAKQFNEDSANAFGHFVLTQSVGFASPEVLQSLFERVPENMHDKIYELKKKHVDTALEYNTLSQQYLNAADKALMETAVGKKFLDFELNNIYGGKVLFSDLLLSGNHSVLIFWGSWDKVACDFLKDACSLCVQYEKNGVNLVSVSLDSSVDKCVDFVSGIEGTALHLCNPRGGSAEVASGYGVSALPHALLINRQGTILLRTNSIKDIESKLKELY